MGILATIQKETPKMSCVKSWISSVHISQALNKEYGSYVRKVCGGYIQQVCDSYIRQVCGSNIDEQIF